MTTTFYQRVKVPVKEDEWPEVSERRAAVGDLPSEAAGHAMLAGASDASAVEVESAVLRHQLAVLRRGARRLRLRQRDRLLVAVASGLMARGRWSAAREECLGHVLVCGRRHLERTVCRCVAHEDAERPHRSLALATPTRTPFEARGSPTGEIARRNVLAASSTNTPRRSLSARIVWCAARPVVR